MTAQQPKRRSGSVHFAVALACLLGATVVIYLFKWTEKLPVPWPAEVVVDEQFCLTSLPEKIGPYVLAGDGELTKDKDNKPDGIIRIRRSIIKTLGIGTSTDHANHFRRRSNWYAVRIYRDSRKAKNQPYRLWRLEVYYYTGVADKVPHVPEICLDAAGARVLDSQVRRFVIPAARRPWQKGVEFRRTSYHKPDRFRGDSLHADYYIFSVNDRPENSREVVRARLWDPRVSYCYFAKIQFSPLNEVSDFDQADRSARDFVKYCLPEVLKMLPTRDEIERLRNRSPSAARRE